MANDKLATRETLKKVRKAMDERYVIEGEFSPNTIVGKSLLSDNFDTKMVLTDNSGYLYRTTGGSLEVGKQNRVKKIIGASVPIIQLIKNGNFESTSDWYISGGTRSVANNKITVTSGNSYSDVNIQPDYVTTFISGHQYLQIATVKIVSATNTPTRLFGMNDGNYATAFGDVNNPVVGTTYNFVRISGINTSATKVYLQVNKANVSDTVVFEVSKVNVIDLTVTFGTTVANRLYALEQAQAGTGIAKAKEILVKDYYPYNVTAFTHTKTSGKQNVGFNQLNLSQWLIDNNITNLSSVSQSDLYQKTLWVNETGFSGRIQITKENFVRNSGSTGYVYFRFHYTDGTNSEVSSARAHLDNGTPYISNEGKTVAWIWWSYTDLCTYNFTNGRLCVSFYWDGERAGEIEDYQEWNYPVEDRELKGILSLDAQDNWVADGDEYLPSGVVDENVIEYTCGANENLTDYSNPTGTGNMFALNIAGNPEASIGSLFNVFLRATKFTPTPWTGVTPTSTMTICQAFNGKIYVKVSDSATSAETKTALDGVKILFKKKTPTQTSADPYTELQNDSNWGMEKWIDTRDVPLPVFSTCEYIPDLKAKLESVPESPEEDGDYIMHRENGLNSYASLSTWLSANGYVKWTAVDLSDIGTMTVTTVAANVLYRVDIAVVNDIGEGQVVVGIGNNTYWAINKNGEALVVFADEDLTGETIDYVAILS